MTRTRKFKPDLESKIIKLDAEFAHVMIEADDIIRNKWE